MVYVNKEQIKKAKSIDLLTYLQNYHPTNLKKYSRNEYRTVDHDSLVISNGLWHWCSRGIGGKNAVQYLMEVYGYEFYDAVVTILDEMEHKEPVIQVQKTYHRKFQLPEKSDQYDKVIDYLESRGIDRAIIGHCIYSGLIYQEKSHGNVVFVGNNVTGDPCYASQRGTGTQRFHQEVAGSNKHYSFQLHLNEENHNVHVFEAPIDALSYATLLKLKGYDWSKENYLSLGGVYMSDSLTEPLALKTYLNRHEVEYIVLHLDNDEVGRGAAKMIKEIYADKYKVIDKPPQSQKDVNEFLINQINKNKERNDVR